MPQNSRLWSRSVFAVLMGASLFHSAAAGAADETDSATADESLPEGHSVHGEAFNEGPRQAAWLMTGTGRIDFPVTTTSEEAQAFIEQGVGQLHGFWYFEAERSFRQAASLDPECAMAYWGMAMANKSKSDRTKGFMEEAVKRKDKVTDREQRYITALDTYHKAKSGTADEKEQRGEKYIEALEEIVDRYPEDLEAKALLAGYLWMGKSENVKAPSYFAVDALIADVLDREPLHPVHHYRIHLWDSKKAERALEAAALCGPSAPSIAHMWHMPGHIYSRLHRYQDAVYQQEASARVDHAHMMHDLVLPDQIHNFAHNNEWLIRNLIHIGRANDGLELAKNMIEHPRHPKYNDINKSGSYRYGHQRLLDVLREFELHDELIRLSDTAWLQDTGKDSEDLKRDRYLATAYALTGHTGKANAIRQRLQEQLDRLVAEQTAAEETAVAKAKEEKKDDKEIEKAKADAARPFASKKSPLEQAIQEIDGSLAAHAGDWAGAEKQWKDARGVPTEWRVAALTRSGDHDAAVKLAESNVPNNKGEVLPLAAQVEALWAADRRDDARKAFDALREISATMDVDLPVMRRLAPIAAALEFGADWRPDLVVADDVGARPPLNSLGPFRWQPIPATPWELPDINNDARSLAEFRGKPLVVIFFLGEGCLHCAEQLQKFGPKTAEFRDAGFEILAISSDAQTELAESHKNYGEEFPFLLVADPELSAFRAYRCFDDFEKTPLHGTFVIDANGQIRWQDISFEPFMDPDFVLKEAQRLIRTDHPGSSPNDTAPQTAVTSVGSE